MNLKSVLLTACVLAVPVFTVCSYAQQGRYPGAQSSDGFFDVGKIHVVPVQGNIYMLVGGGANIAVSVGVDGVLFVDTGSAEMADQVLAAVRQLAKPLTHNPIRYIIDTSADADHVGGNAAIRKAGETFTGGNVAGDLARLGEDPDQGAGIIAHEAVVDRMSAPSGKPQPFPSEAIPTDSYAADEMKVSEFFNGEGIRIVHMPAAHTDGDSIVHFTKSDVIATGDVFMTTSYPVIDVARGGGIQGEVDALNRILDMAIPQFRMENGTLIIPGHGRLSDAADVAYYRDMVTIVRDRIQGAIKRGMTLGQVKEAKLTRDFDGRYGSTTGPWTTDKFIEAVYQSLTPKK